MGNLYLALSITLLPTHLECDTSALSAIILSIKDIRSDDLLVSFSINSLYTCEDCYVKNKICATTSSKPLKPRTQHHSSRLTWLFIQWTHNLALHFELCQIIGLWPNFQTICFTLFPLMTSSPSQKS